MEGGELCFTLGKDGCPMVKFSVDGHPAIKVSGIVATRFCGNAIIPLSLLPKDIQDELLALPPIEKGDPKCQVDDILFGRIRCVKRKLGLRFHAENAEWDCRGLEVFLGLDGKLPYAMFGCGFITSECKTLMLDFAKRRMRIWLKQ
jgi:hypothetical protein